MKKRSILIVNLLLFTFIFVYFTVISPLVPFDGDDWRYIGAIRTPFPLWGVWNPTRVLPEVLMPVGGYIAAFLIYPITGNYINALTIAESFIVSAFVSIFLWLFYRLLVKRFKLSKKLSLALELIFFLSFFLLFKHSNQPSYNGFWTVDLACDFFYLIPGLLNASLIMFMSQTRDFSSIFKGMSNLKKGIFILVIYFALFSNTQLTIILATFSFAMILENFIKLKKINLSFFEKTWIYFIILIIWLCTIFFDLNGQRAKNVQNLNNIPFATSVKATLNELHKFILIQNTKILLLFAIILILGILISIKFVVDKEMNGQEYLKYISEMMLCLILSLAYLVIAYTKAGSQYTSRSDAMWPVIFFFLLACNLSLAFLINQFQFTKIFLPLGIVLMSLIAFSFNYHQVPANNVMYSFQTARAVDNYIIKQVVNADKKGKSKVVVKVPKDQENISPKSAASNWPHSYEMATWLQNTLYSHHIIRTRIQILFKPEKSVNKMFYENRYKQQPFVPLE